MTLEYYPLKQGLVMNQFLQFIQQTGKCETDQQEKQKNQRRIFSPIKKVGEIIIKQERVKHKNLPAMSTQFFQKRTNVFELRQEKGAEQNNRDCKQPIKELNKKFMTYRNSQKSERYNRKRNRDETIQRFFYPAIDFRKQISDGKIDPQGKGELPLKEFRRISYK